MVVAITSGVSLICTILLWRSQKVARDTAACFDRIEAVGFKRSANAQRVACMPVHKCCGDRSTRRAKVDALTACQGNAVKEAIQLLSAPDSFEEGLVACLWPLRTLF